MAESASADVLGGLLEDDPTERLTWRPLLWFTVLRVASACVLFGLTQLERPLRWFGTADPELYWRGAVAYLIGAAVGVALLTLRRPRFNLQTTLAVLTDVGAITVLVHASGGLVSGLGILLVIVVAGGSLLVSGRLAFLYAAMASLALLAESVYRVNVAMQMPTYTQAGLLGAACFATAGMAFEMARRARRGTALASSRRSEIMALARLNTEIIQRMQTGVLVVDPQQRIRLVNGSAARLLGRRLAPGDQLHQVAPTLHDVLLRWQAGWEPGPAAADLWTPRFAPLGRGAEADLLVFLDDTGALNQQAQLLKLASLGRLVASIAHQVRNPLGAISHAAQLLAEDAALSSEHKQLTSILLRQSDRVNRIIEEVLALGRPQTVDTEVLDLKPWLEKVIDAHCSSHGVAPEIIRRELAPDLATRAAPGQLQQVIDNVLDNALRHSRRAQAPKVTVRARASAARERPIIEIEDRGPGVPAAERDKLFEPFHTSRADGTGLGLFMARELCAANQAHIEYYEPAAGGAGFRILLADRRRRQLT